MKLDIAQRPTESRPLLAKDHTAWSRADAVTLKERTIEHQPTQIAGNKPIAVGQGLSTIAWRPEAQGSWALPLRHQRITSWETAWSRAAFQLKQVCQYLTVRPIAADDSEYGKASFVKQTAGIEAERGLRDCGFVLTFADGALHHLTLARGDQNIGINLTRLTRVLGENLRPDGR